MINSKKDPNYQGLLEDGWKTFSAILSPNPVKLVKGLSNVGSFLLDSY